ncbi:MAG TPA: lysophospholipid acyltransferase family protein, partial [Alphaproteobacteria bacterium]|nr:lysophospholipid acyltransferase family protein [Alphaproteobacteria bacterium]
AALEAEGRPYIVCCWHGRMLLICCVRPKDMPVLALASGHRDGQFVAKVMARFGVGTISGSTRRGGHGAIQACRAALADGAVVVITPDGPRGPAMRAAPGAIRLARLSGAAIIPVSSATHRRIFLKTWDRFMVPLPFGTGAFVCGAPLHVTDSAAEEDANLQLEQALNAASRMADELARG